MATWLALALLSGAYHLLVSLPQFIPHDSGLLGQSAERVLMGEWPHIDFDEMYTGGLTFVHAAAFQLFGVSFATLRWLVLVVFACTTPLLYFVARSFTSRWMALLVAALGVVWSLPSYPESMPSWYNLFLAYVAITTALAWNRTGRSRYLFLAGLAAGVSVAVKISGLYLVAALGLFVIYYEQTQPAIPMAKEGNSAIPSVFKVVFAVLLTAGLLLLVRTQLDATTALLYVVPPAAAAAFLAWDEIAFGRAAPLPRRLADLGRWVLVLAAGILLPILALTAAFLSRGGLEQWLQGVFLSPMSRTAVAAMPPPPVSMALFALPILGVMVWGWLSRGSRLLAVVILVALALFLVGVLALATEDAAYRLVWFGLRPTGALISLFSMMVAARSRALGRVKIATGLFLLACSASFLALIQFPYALGVYFCYAAPVFWLTWGATTGTLESHPSRLATVMVLAFLVVFGGMQHRNDARLMSIWPVPGETPASWTNEKAGIRVGSTHPVGYDAVVDLIHLHDGGSPFIYAGPDSPEVYFLSGRRNPFRTMYEVFGAVSLEALLDRDRDPPIYVLVINLEPEFSKPWSESDVRTLAQRYPHGQRVGSRLVMWREKNGLSNR